MTNLNQLIERRQGEVREAMLGTKTNTIPDDAWHTALYESKAEKLNEATTQTATEAYRQALEDVLAGLPGEVSVYLHAHHHMTDRELRDEEMRVFGMNYRLKTVRAQIEGLLSKIE